MGQSRAISIQPFRANDWWRSKASLLMGFVYLYTLWFHISLDRFLPLAIFSVIVIAGFASFGYLVNDFFDKEKDQLAGKRNFLLNKSISVQLLLFIASLFFIVLPWIYLPKSTVSFILIGVQLSLFLLYSAPPFRLKERGAAGVVIDSLYAHALPTMLAAFTFFLASTITPPFLGFLLLFFWQFLCGIRNILIHQMEDKESDTASGTMTFIGSVSLERGIQIIQYTLVMEILLSITFFSFLLVFNYWFALCLSVIGVMSIETLIKYRTVSKGEFPSPPLRYFPNNVYEKWLPVVYLALLSYGNIYFLVILVLHITFFNFDLYRQITDRIYKLFAYHLWPWVLNKVLIPLRGILSAIVNYAIYYSLLPFGIDLRKEQMSAMDYFKKRKGNNT